MFSDDAAEPDDSLDAEDAAFQKHLAEVEAAE